MFDLLLQPSVIPFAVALGLMLALALLEVVTVLLGIGLSDALESMLPDVDLPDVDLPDVDAPDVDLPDVELDGGNAIDAVSSPGIFALFAAWLCIGRVPALIIFIAFLTAFGITGLVVQQAAISISGVPLATLIAVAVSLLIALPLTRYVALAFAWIMPQTETEAVEQTSFVGQVAEVIRGTARVGEPAEAKLSDRYGKVHYLLVEPEAGGRELSAGAKVVVLEKRGAAFLAADADAALADGQTLPAS